MTQANSVHSTPPTNTSANNIVDPSRRGFLAQAAVVAAGGAALGVALPLPVSAGGAERVLDPTFALIEAHRAAEAAHMVACAEHSKCERIVIDEGIGLRPFTVMMDDNGHVTVVYAHGQIDAYSREYVSEQVAAKAHADLDRVLARYDEIMGDSEDESGRLGDVALEALDELISSVPTTALGLRAMVSYLADDVVDVGQQLQREQVELLLTTMSDALQALHPAV